MHYNFGNIVWATMVTFKRRLLFRSYLREAATETVNSGVRHICYTTECLQAHVLFLSATSSWDFRVCQRFLYLDECYSQTTCYIQSSIPGFCKRQRDSKMTDYESETKSVKASMALSIFKPLNPHHPSASHQHRQKLTDIQSRTVELH